MSRIVGRRVRSGDQETESTNQRLLRRGSVSTSAVQNRAVREIKRWPGSKPVQGKDLDPGLVEELDDRFVAGRTLTLVRDTVQQIGHNSGAGDEIEFEHAAGRWVGFGDLDLPVDAPPLPVDGVWGMHVTLTLGAVPEGTEVLIVDAASGGRLWPLGTTWVAGRAYTSPVQVGPLRVPHRPWSDGTKPAVRVVPPSGQTVDVEYAEATWGIEGSQVVSTPPSLGGYHVQINIGSNELVLRRRVDGQPAEHDQLASTPFSASSDVWYWMRGRVDGARLRAKIWSAGIGDEPSAWMIDHTDAEQLALTAGYAGVGSPIPALNDTAGERRVDDIRVAIDGDDEVATDFSTYEIGPLTDEPEWETAASYLSGRWQVDTASGATGGQAAVFGPESTAGGHWAVFTGAGRGEDMDVYARVSGSGNQATGIILRAVEHTVDG